METNNLTRNLAEKTAQSVLFRNVYTWMTLALVITGAVAMYMAKSMTLLSMIMQNSLLFWGILIAELGVVWYLSARIHRISFTSATLLFILYSILNGATLSMIFLIYTMSSIATTFFVTAGTFGVMALFGYVTKKDLTRLGSLCFMEIIGITAYDSQKIKRLLMQDGVEINETTQKIALLGAMTLYLDFINLFLYLLRILGDRK